MVDKLASLDEVVAAALQLSRIEKVRLVEKVVSTLENDVTPSEKKPLKTYYGILAHLGPGPSDEDIAEVRRDMIKNFPRDAF
jgi:hypothetical protein